jgi:hypothetical protein
MTAESVNRQSMANNRTLTMVVVGVVILIAVGLGLFFLLHKSSTHKKTTKGKHYNRINAVLETAPQLKAESSILGTPIYWAGPLKGYSYEFTRATTGNMYVRYLPKGLRADAPGANFLIISTYPFIGAYQGLKKASHGAALPGQNGGILYVNPKYRQSVLMAWPNINYQVEVYDPKPAVSLSTAESGQVKPVNKP